MASSTSLWIHYNGDVVYLFTDDLCTGGGGIFRVARKGVCCLKPWQSVVHPVVVHGAHLRSAVERACSDFKLVRQGGIEEHELGSAMRTKGSLALGKFDFSRNSANKPDAARWKKCPRNNWGARCFPAIFAVAKGSPTGRGRYLVANFSAEAGTFHLMRKLANSRSIRRPVQTLSSQISATGFCV
jgi:hypothetical protein